MNRRLRLARGISSWIGFHALSATSRKRLRAASPGVGRIGAFILAAGLAGGAAQAQVGFAVPPSQDFTFRRVAPPPPGATKRIILKENSSPRNAAPAPAAADAAGAFWSRPGAQPGLSPRRPLVPAIEAARAAAGPVRAAARARADRETARRLMSLHGPALQAAASRADLSLPLLLAVAIAESGGDSRAVSPRGAQGLMQLMPATAAQLGVDDPFSAPQAAAGAAAHLDALLRRFGEDPLAALAAYNAGPEAVARHRGAPPYAETRAYVPRVLLALSALSPLCLAPPLDPRSPCMPSAALAGFASTTPR